MTVDRRRPRIALAASDVGNSECGVGNMLGSLLDRLPDLDPVLVDTAAPRAELRRTARRAAAEADVLVAVYPTRSTVRRWWALARMLALRWWFRGSEVRLYLHEFGRLGTKHRAGIIGGLLLTTGRVVVCVPSEADSVRRALGGLAVRGQEVVAVPAPNGTAPAEADVAVAVRAPAGGRRRTVGVFGALRPDKGTEWLDRVLQDLDPRFDRLELAGSGWDGCRFSPGVLDRYEVHHLGHVPTADLPEVFGRWGLAVAPFWEGGAHDGRTSLRTSLAFGVPTLTRGPRSSDLSIDVPHLHFDTDGPLAEVAELGEPERRAAADRVAAYEADVVRRTAAALFDAAP